MGEMGLKNLGIAAIAMLSLSAISVIAIAVVTGFKTSGALDSTGNDTADDFIAGLAIFGTFSSVIALGLVGKIIVGIFKKE